MSLPILYSFRRCPYAMRARLALDAAEIEVEHREVLLRDKPDAMLSASPKGTVPVLVEDSGNVIDESLDIMIWALAQNDPDNWLESYEKDKADAIAFLNDFKPALDQYKYASRYKSDAARGDVDLDQRTKAFSTLASFIKPLTQNDNLRADRPRLIDMATFPFVRQFAAVEPNWWAESARRELQDWLGRHLQSDRFQRIMRKHPVWQPAPSKQG